MFGALVYMTKNSQIFFIYDGEGQDKEHAVWKDKCIVIFMYVRS